MKLKKTETVIKIEKTIEEPIEDFLCKEENIEKSANHLARELGVTAPTIIKWRNKLGIENKGQKESVKMLSRRPSKERLIQLFREGYGTTALAVGHSVTEVTIRNWYNHYGIKRDYSSGNRKQNHLEVEPGSLILENRDVKRRKARTVKMIEAELDEPIEEYLKREYGENQRSASSIATELGSNAATILSTLSRKGIEVRGVSESIRLLSKKPNKSELERLVEEGLTNSEIGEMYGVASSTAGNWRGNYGLSRIEQTDMPEKEELERLYKGLKTVGALAKHLKISAKAAKEYLQDSGIEITHKKEGRGFYESQGNRRQAVERILLLSGKSPEELTTWDFQHAKYKKEEASKVSFGVLLWYKKKSEGSYTEALSNLVADLYNTSLKTKPINSEKDLERFLVETPEARVIADLCSVTETTSDIAEVLVKAWPAHFPSAADLANSLPKAVRRIGYALQPFSIERIGDVKEETKTLPRKIQYSLDELLFSIVYDNYQIQFNKDPKGTISELRKFAKEKGPTQPLAKRVLESYTEIYNFSIPGQGRMTRHAK